MLNFLRDWIINIVTISIILILFEMIIPSGKIKKIINLVSGFILLIVVITPFLSLKNQDFDLGKATLADSYYIDRKEIENSSKLMKDEQMKQISGVYKKKISNAIQEEINKLDGVSGSKVDVVINDDYSSDKYGELKKVNIEITKGEKENEGKEVKPVASVKKVEIKSPDISLKAEDGLKTGSQDGGRVKESRQQENEDKKLIELIKENLNKMMEIQKDNITVTIS